MKLTKALLSIALAMSFPVTTALSVNAQISPSGVASPLDAAKERLEKAKVRLDIARKQVDASRARLKAAEAEFKAAKAHHEAKELADKAAQLSDESGLPAITENMINSNRRQIAINEKPKKEAAPKQQAAPVDLSGTRLNQVDFNAQPATGQPQRIRHQSYNMDSVNLRPTLTASAAPAAVVPASTNVGSSAAVEQPSFVP